MRKLTKVGQVEKGKILDAALSLFSRGDATIAEIAKLAEIPKSNVHYYFDTKDKLYQEVLETARSRRCRESVYVLMIEAIKSDSPESIKDLINAL